MLTRREKLLIRPWQLRRYNNHRKKVLTALPVIDFGPPAQRGHVALKLKKLQREGERRTKIEEDNFRLLQRMGAIMKKKRLDNYWETKPPNFLGRVGIYHRTRSPTPCADLTSNSPSDITSSRKSRCVACAAQQKKDKYSSECRLICKTEPKNCLKNDNPTTALLITTSDMISSHWKINCSSAQNRTIPTTTKYLNNPIRFHDTYLPNISKNSGKNVKKKVVEKRIVLEQGSLHLAVNFPIHVDVKLQSIKGKHLHGLPHFRHSTKEKL